MYGLRPWACKNRAMELDAVCGGAKSQGAWTIYHQRNFHIPVATFSVLLPLPAVQPGAGSSCSEGTELFTVYTIVSLLPFLPRSVGWKALTERCGMTQPAHSILQRMSNDSSCVMGDDNSILAWA